MKNNNANNVQEKTTIKLTDIQNAIKLFNEKISVVFFDKGEDNIDELNKTIQDYNFSRVCDYLKTESKKSDFYSALYIGLLSCKQYKLSRVENDHKRQLDSYELIIDNKTCRKAFKEIGKEFKNPFKTQKISYSLAWIKNEESRTVIESFCKDFPKSRNALKELLNKIFEPIKVNEKAIQFTSSDINFLLDTTSAKVIESNENSARVQYGKVDDKIASLIRYKLTNTKLLWKKENKTSLQEQKQEVADKQMETKTEEKKG